MTTGITTRQAQPETRKIELGEWRRFARGLLWIATGVTISLGTVIGVVLISPLIAIPQQTIGINDFGEILAFFAPVIAGLGGIVGGIVALVGDWMCTGVPPSSGLQSRTKLIAILMSLGLALTAINPILVIADVPSLAALTALVSVLALFSRNVLFVLLLKQVADLCGEPGIGIQLPRFFLYWLAGGLLVAVACGIFVGGGVALAEGADGLLAGIGFFLVAAGVFIAYSVVLLLWLRRLIVRTRKQLTEV